MSNLEGKFAVVTGAAQGIGVAVVKRFYEEGAAGIAILDYNLDAAQKTAAQYPDRVIALQCDVSDSACVHACVEQIHQQFGRIDILVNNAGITRDAMFHNMTEEKWHKVIGTNLDGTFYCLKAVIPHMTAQGYGKIVNISSSSAHGNVGQANYSASKAALLGLTKTLARELAAKGITVNAVSPCNIDTEMFSTIPEKLLNYILQASPIHRLGTVDELAASVFFLSCDDSRYITGIELPVNGGMFT